MAPSIEDEQTSMQKFKNARRGGFINNRGQFVGIFFDRVTPYDQPH